MRVTVHLHTILQRQDPQGTLDNLQVLLPSGSSLEDLLRHLDIRMNPEDLLLVVNGRMADAGQILQDSDQVNLVPAISGGD